MPKFADPKGTTYEVFLDTIYRVLEIAGIKDAKIYKPRHFPRDARIDNKDNKDGRVQEETLCHVSPTRT